MPRADRATAPAVGDGDGEYHSAVGGGGLLGLTDRGDDRVREEIELADGADPHAEAVGPRMTGELDELGRDRLQNAGDLTRVPAEVLRRQDPEAHRGDRQLVAPEEHVVELPRAERVRLERVDEPSLERVSAGGAREGGRGRGGGGRPRGPHRGAPPRGEEGTGHATP